MHEGLSLGPQSNKKVGYDGSVLIVTAMAYNHRWDGEKGKPLQLTIAHWPKVAQSTWILQEIRGSEEARLNYAYN